MTKGLRLQRLRTAADLLGISVPKVKDLIHSGQITAYRIGPKNCIRVPQAEIERLKQKGG